MLINKRDPEGAKGFLRKCLEDMFTGKYDIKYFMQSRTLKLKESYKDWTKIGHVFLSEKIAQRDPGNKPQSGDRIEFVVIKVPNDDPKKKLLQGELIETPTFIKQNNSEIDYLFYMTNQIQKPATQFLELVDDKIEELFNEFIDKFGKPKPVKIIKEKVIVEKKPRAPRKKIIKVDEVKPEEIVPEEVIPKEIIPEEIIPELKIKKLSPKKKTIEI
jgi:DNA polymerase elongation subunit (family B)